MKKSLTTICYFLSAIAFLAAAILFVTGNNKTGGLAMGNCLLLLATAFLVNKRLSKYAYTIFILAAVTFAITFPQYFTSIGNFQLKKLIVPLLQIIMLGVGCTLSWTDLAGVLKMPKAVFIGVVCQFTVMPFVGLGIATLFAFPPEIAAGVVLVGCMPGGLASNVITFLAKANVALSVTLTAVSTLLAPLLSPFLMQQLGGQFVPIDFWAMLVDILKMVIVPVFLGVLLNYFLKNKTAMINKVMPLISMAGIVFIIVIITAAGRDSLLTIGVTLVVAMFLHMMVGLLLGYFSARILGLSELNARTVGIEVGMQNGGLASGIAVQMGKMATVGLAPAVNGPIMNTFFSLIATWWGSKPAEQESKKR